MKKLILLLIISMSLTACTAPDKTDFKTEDKKDEIEISDKYDGEVNTFDGMTITINEDTLTPSGATVTILNTTDSVDPEKDEISSGKPHLMSVHVYKDNAWYKVKQQKEVGAITSEAYIYLKDKPMEVEVNWAEYYGELPEGKYRLVKTFTKGYGPESEDFTLAAEFNIEWLKEMITSLLIIEV